MSISGIGSSPALQWLQSYLSSSGSATGSQSSCGCPPASDTASISQKAVQLNASQASQTSDPSQTSGVNGSQGHHHHHRHGGGQGGSSFMDQLAKSIVSDLQSATGNGDASGSVGSAAPAQASGNGGSFIDQLASVIAGDLLAKYQQATGSAGAGTSPQSGTANQVNAIA